MSFDRLARHYRWMERILAGEKLHACRVAFVDEIKPPSRVLLMGEGHGRFLEVVRERFPDASVTILDSSTGMLDEARRGVEKRDDRATLRFEHHDALEWRPHAESFDLIATHFFLDCFTREQLATLIPKLAGVLEPGGIWMVADFRLPEQGWRRFRARAIHAVMYVFFRAATGLSARRLTPPDAFLTQAGLHLEKRCVREWGLLHSDLWRNAP